jgi:hypothetical protein
MVFVLPPARQLRVVLLIGEDDAWVAAPPGWVMLFAVSTIDSAVWRFVQDGLRQKSPYGNGRVDDTLGLGTYPLQIHKPKVGETSPYSKASWGGVYPPVRDAHSMMVRSPTYGTNLWSRFTYQKDEAVAYAGWPDERLLELAERCAKAAGLELTFAVDTTNLGRLPPELTLRAVGPFKRLKIFHSYDSNHAEVLDAFLASWLCECPHVPPIELTSLRVVRTSDHPVRVTPADSLHIAKALLGAPRDEALQLSEPQIRALTSWARSQGLPETDDPLRILASLIETPLAKLTPAARQAAIDAHVAVGTMSPFPAAFWRVLEKAHSANALDGVVLNLSVHLLCDAYSLLQGLMLFGRPAEVNLLTSSYSGDPAMRHLADLWGMRVLGPDAAPDFFHPHSLTLRSAGGARPHDFLVRATRRTVWLKSSQIKDAVSQEYQRALWHPEQRFIIQNRSDKDRFNVDGAQGVKLFDSPMKHLEAQVVGEVAALTGAREVRKRWQKRIGDVDVCIVGAGLIGGDIGKAFGRLGMPTKRTHVIDPDPEVRDRFAALGCAVYADLAAYRQRARPEHAYVFVATPDVPLGTDELRTLGRHTLVQVMTTDGRGIGARARRMHDVLQRTSSHAKRRPASAQVWRCGIDRNAPRELPDLYFELGGDTCAILANGYPLGLVDPRAQRRFELTSMALLDTILEAAEMKAQRGWRDVNQLTHADGVRLAGEHGLLDTKPLQGDSEPDAALLLADLEAFRPS